MFRTIESLEEFNRFREEVPALLAYFSTDACNVCKVLKPKTERMLRAEFPEMKAVYIQSDVLPEIAGQHRVFAVPTILIFFDGRETIRKSRHISLDELRNEIGRPYGFIFS
jgi:thioredoxin 1